MRKPRELSADKLEALRQELELLAHPQFTAEQWKELSDLGLRSEQVERLEELLPEISAYLRRPRPRVQDVRDILDDLANAAYRLEKRYARLVARRQPASDQARTRLDFAHEILGYPDWKALPDAIQTVSRVITTARESVSKERRNVYRNHAYLVGLIHGVLQEGSPQSRIAVTRKKKPFPNIVQIMSEASGGWSADDAIRVYLQRKSRK